MTKFLLVLHNVVWGIPALALYSGIGIYLGIRTGFPQRHFLRGMKQAMRSSGTVAENTVPTYKALATALAGTVGTGNISGVAGALCLGGPGAVFWMWVSACIGMAVKYAEAALAVRYRKHGQAGPMYYITEGMGPKHRPLAAVYCILGMSACLGIGNLVQTNAICAGASVIYEYLKLSRPSPWMLGLAIALPLALVFAGGISRIGTAAVWLVAFGGGAYVLLCLGILAVYHNRIPGAFHAILLGAFSPQAVTGGAIGSCFLSLRTGCARGIFSNEAGLGTAAMAHGSAACAHPAGQGYFAMAETCADTLLICTLTALTILVSGVPIPYTQEAGLGLTCSAFSGVYGETASALLAGCMMLFAFATVLSWGLYGSRCAAFLFGRRGACIFTAFHTVAAACGTVLDTQTVWCAAEVLNGLMAVPNFIALTALSGELSRLTKEYGG